MAGVGPKGWAETVSARPVINPTLQFRTPSSATGFSELPEQLPGANERGTTALANIFNEKGQKQVAPLVKKVSGQNANAARSLSKNAKSYITQGSLDEIFDSMGIFNKDVIPQGTSIQENAEMKEERQKRLESIYTSSAFQEGAIKLAFIRLIISGRIQYKESIFGIFDKVIGTKFSFSNSSKLNGNKKTDFDKVLKLIADDDVDSFDFHYRGGLRKLAFDMFASLIIGGAAVGVIHLFRFFLLKGDVGRAEYATKDLEKSESGFKEIKLDIKQTFDDTNQVHTYTDTITDYMAATDKLYFIREGLNKISDLGKYTRPGTHYHITFQGKTYTKDEFLEHFTPETLKTIIDQTPILYSAWTAAEISKSQLKEEAAEVALAAGIFAIIPGTLIPILIMKLIIVYAKSSNDKQLIIDVLIKLLDNFIRSDPLIFRALESESIQNIPLLFNDADSKAIYYKYVNEMKRLGLKQSKEEAPPLAMSNFLTGGDCAICQQKLATPFMKTIEICTNHHKFHILCIKSYNTTGEGVFKCPMCTEEVTADARATIKEYSPLKTTEGGSRKTRRNKKRKLKSRRYRK